MSYHPHLSQAIEWLRQLVAFDTIPANDNKPLVAHIAARLRQEHNINSHQMAADNGKVSFLATIGPKVEGGIVLSGHTDVVDTAGQNWTSPPYELLEKNDNLYARGSCDMKGFLACALAMTPVFAAANLTRPIHLAFSRDEELGCAGSPDMIRMIGLHNLRPAIAIIGEPTLMQTIAGHKTGLAMKTEFFGSPAHSSMPDAGISAIPYAARLVLYLKDKEAANRAAADLSSPFNPPYGTANVGIIEGGVALNIFAEYCKVTWHYRGMPQENVDAFVADVEDFLQNTLLPDMRASGHPVDIINTRTSSYPGLLFGDSPAIALVESLTDNRERHVVSFGTEAGYFQQANIPAVVIGPGSIEQAHKPDEFIAIEQLSECLYFLDKIRAHLSA